MSPHTFLVYTRGLQEINCLDNPLCFFLIYTFTLLVFWYQRVKATLIQVQVKSSHQTPWAGPVPQRTHDSSSVVRFLHWKVNTLCSTSLKYSIIGSSQIQEDCVCLVLLHDDLYSWDPSLFCLTSEITWGASIRKSHSLICITGNGSWREVQRVAYEWGSLRKTPFLE